ncbi:hypothetical protein OQX63_17345 [Pedobacter sp. PF22-3]|uniref:hypothetical protein n=1 Tax=Pedobacter sp. PF22-3 TaxID=2994467 RepID=UPI002245440A|nr:hypothetical protein [Pedobacter sp. PF22-3]MCX2495259.1 hypothetical protein [Pedobacter sp. PF22-3]
MAKEICKDEKVEKFVSGVAPAIVRKGVTLATGYPAIGDAAGAVTSGLSRSHSKPVAEVVTSVGLDIAICAASVVAAPVIAGVLIWEAFFGD